MTTKILTTSSKIWGLNRWPGGCLRWCHLCVPKPTEILISPSVMPTSSLCCRDNLLCVEDAGCVMMERVSPKLGEMDNIITPLIIFTRFYTTLQFKRYDATPAFIWLRATSQPGCEFKKGYLTYKTSSLCSRKLPVWVRFHNDDPSWPPMFPDFRQNPGIKGDSVGPAFRIKGMIWWYVFLTSCDHATQHSTLTINEFCGWVDDQICTQAYWVLQVGRNKTIVHYQKGIVLVAQVRKCFKIVNIEGRVGRGLEVKPI